MIDISKMIYELCEDPHVYDEDFDLIDSGIMDSLMLIDLISQLEDEDIEIQITQVDFNAFRTVRSIQKLIDEYQQ